MNTYLKKDIEETRRLEKEERREAMNAAEIMSVALMHEAANGKVSDMMVMLDMVAARIILEVSERLEISVDSIIELHSEHTRKTIKLLKERM